MPAIEIRRATENDAQDLARVHVQAWQWAYRGLMPDSLLDGLDVERRAAGWKRMIYEGLVPQPHLAVIGSKVAGFSHANTSGDDDADPQIGEVTALYLLEGFVGTGVGRRLWEAVTRKRTYRFFRVGAGFKSARTEFLRTNGNGPGRGN